MRVAIAGIHNEASGFSMHEVTPDFFRYDRGGQLLSRYDFAGRIPAGELDGVEFVPVLVAMGGASGPVPPEVYDAIETEIVAGLRAAGPLDGVYLHMHGAVMVTGREAAEERFLGVVREVVGDIPVGISMDPHGNFSPALAALVDLAGCHRFSPHIDNALTPTRVVRQLIRVVRTGERPLRAHVRIPVLLPGERTSTATEPGATVFAAVRDEIEAHPEILDASLWVGFAWADEPRNSAAAMVTGWEEAAVMAAAERIARGYWDAREDFAIVSDHVGSYDEALDFLLTSPPAPLFISDSGDNVTAGSSGDITYALERTLARAGELSAAGKRVLVAGICDPDAVAAAVRAGARSVLNRAVGAHTDVRYGAPAPGPWRVLDLIEGRAGEGIVGAVLEREGIHVTVQTTRRRFVIAGDPSESTNGSQDAAVIDVAGYDAVVVKNGYLFPSQVDASGSDFMALTPGGTDLDLGRLDFRRRAVPLFPFERDFRPDLAPVLLPRIGG